MGMLMHRHYTEIRREEEATKKVAPTPTEAKVEVKEKTEEPKKKNTRKAK